MNTCTGQAAWSQLRSWTPESLQFAARLPQEVENSEELQRHKERAHPTGMGGKSMDNLEKPDLLQDPPEESATSEIPTATHQRR